MRIFRIIIPLLYCVIRCWQYDNKFPIETLSFSRHNSRIPLKFHKSSLPLNTIANLHGAQVGKSERRDQIFLFGFTRPSGRFGYTANYRFLSNLGWRHQTLNRQWNMKFHTYNNTRSHSHHGSMKWRLFNSHGMSWHFCYSISRSRFDSLLRNVFQNEKLLSLN